MLTPRVLSLTPYQTAPPPRGSQSKANGAVAMAAMIAQRAHHGAAKIPGDLTALENLVHSGQELDDISETATDRVAASHTKTGEKKSAKEEKDSAGKKMLSVEPAEKVVVNAIERDVAAAHGHPLMIGANGVPLSQANKKIDTLAKGLEAAEQLVDKAEHSDEVDAEELKTPKVGTPAEKKAENDRIEEQITERKETVAKLEKIETKMVDEIKEVAGESAAKKKKSA